jgi:hypothetical protein
MPFGQSALLAYFAGNLVERGAYLIQRADGVSVPEARSRAEEIGISAQVAAGTVAAIVTADPIGGALNLGHAALRENDRSLWRDGK